MRTKPRNCEASNKMTPASVFSAHLRHASIEAGAARYGVMHGSGSVRAADINGNDDADHG
jgi:hypothetical protein